MPLASYVTFTKSLFYGLLENEEVPEIRVSDQLVTKLLLSSNILIVTDPIGWAKKSITLLP